MVQVALLQRRRLLALGALEDARHHLAHALAKVATKERVQHRIQCGIEVGSQKRERRKHRIEIGVALVAVGAVGAGNNGREWGFRCVPIENLHEYSRILIHLPRVQRKIEHGKREHEYDQHLDHAASRLQHIVHRMRLLAELMVVVMVRMQIAADKAALRPPRRRHHHLVQVHRHLALGNGHRAFLVFAARPNQMVRIRWSTANAAAADV